MKFPLFQDNYFAVSQERVSRCETWIFCRSALKNNCTLNQAEGKWAANNWTMNNTDNQLDATVTVY